MSFPKVVKLIERPPVLAGMARMQPEMRALAERLMTRFVEADATPLPIREEGAAFALWGTRKPEAFLEWHRATGGLARVLEVMLAAIAFELVTYEWDSSVWALRTARPSQGLSNLGTTPWLWLRAHLSVAKPAERAATRATADRASRAWLVRTALAFVFPDDDELWTAVEAAELRQVDVDDSANVTFGLLVAMRRAKLDVKRIEKEWNIAAAIPPAAINAALGDLAVPALRLIRAFPELARHPDPDALRALAEFADVAWGELASVKPSRATIEALAPMFTTQRPRRVLGAQLALGLFREHVVADPAAAKQLARGKTHDARFVATVLSETGASLPADDEWRSPWVAKAAPKPQAAKISAQLEHPEAIHWQPGERETRASHGSDRRSPKLDREKLAELPKKAKAETVFILDLCWMTDAPALRVWKALGPKPWYGRVDDVEHLLARFGLDELDSILAFVQSKPDTLAALARVESARVAPLMARGFALLKKQRDIGRAWLDRFPEAAAVGLLRDDGDKKQRGANEAALAHLAKHHRAVVDKVLARAGGTVSSAQLATAAAPVVPAKPPKLPAFVDVARLPRPIRKDGAAALSGAALTELVQLLAVPGIDVDAIVEPYTDASLARCAWSLFRQWLFVKGPPKDKWALYAVGRFPDDDNARALGRLARVWAPQGNPSRAQEAVETLGLMRTQTALLEIYDIARKVQSKALKARAEKVFETVAESMGLAREELADRLVPELTEHDLTFGDQRVEIDARLVPHLKDSDELSADDAKRWKELKRTCGAVARGQIKRLEQAMADGHRMPFSHFAEIFLMHSLIRNISGSLLWGAYRDGERVLFAVEDAGAIDASGAPIDLPIDAKYGVVHPAELTAAERATWAKRYAEQPFEQLARQVFAASDAADCERKLARLRGHAVATTALLALQSRGWTRGESPQGGRYYSIQRTGDGWHAELMFAPGIYLGSPTEEPTQAIEGFVLRAEGAVPAAILSELQRDLLRLIAR